MISAAGANPASGFEPWVMGRIAAGRISDSNGDNGGDDEQSAA